MSSEWLDLSINSRLRDLVNEGGICHFDEQFKAAHNSICIMMDRVDDSGRWLNDHAAFPDSVDEFLLFLVHADIVIKTVLSVLGKVELGNPFRGQNSKKSRQFFSDACLGAPYYLDPANLPEDELVWSYLRALAFAHTEETAAKRYRGIFLTESEIQYSPYPIVDAGDQEVGVMVYSNKWDDIKAFCVPFEKLQQYVRSRYVQLERVVKLAETRIEQQRARYKQEFIDESGGAAATLKILRDKYAERVGECYTYDFDFPLMCLTCKTTCSKNDAVVGEFREALAAVVPSVCAAFRELDYDRSIKMLDDVCCRTTDRCPRGNEYYLQKIYTHLNHRPDNGKRSLALQCAKDVAAGFAAQYVTIDVESMMDDEILLLVTVACFKYRQEDKNGQR